MVNLFPVRDCLNLCVAGVLALITGLVSAAEPLPLAELAKPGRVLILRHAVAPGVGDPSNFRLGDCTTQRNLDATGRKQAAVLGQRLAQAGITHAQVYSSQWCRTLETARLLKLGAVTELPALNSFFELTDTRDANIIALRKFLAGLPVDGPPLVLVTHQVTISAITGSYTSSGGGVILQLDGTMMPMVVSEIMAD